MISVVDLVASVERGRTRWCVARAALWAGLALALIPVSASAQNLVSNPGFENNSGCSAASWASTGNCGANYKYFNDFQHSGLFDLVIGNPIAGSANISQSLNVQAGKYSFSFWYRETITGNGAFTASVGSNTFTFNTAVGNPYLQFTTQVSLPAGATAIVFTNGTGNTSWVTAIDDVSLIFLGPNALTPLLSANASTNQRNVAGSIDTFLANGGTLPPGFQNLTNLSPSALGAAMDQFSGESNAAGRQAGMQLMNSFLSLVVNPFATGRGTGGAGFGPVMGFAPERTIEFPPEVAMAYGSVLKAPLRTDYAQPFSVWASGYGGHANIGGDPTGSGSHDTNTSQYGFATGLDYRISPNSTVGFALAGGATNWGVGNGLGSGNSNVFQSALYGSTRWGAAYLSAAIAYGAYMSTTDRFVTVAGTDRLTADFTAQDLGGRVESGYRINTPIVAVTPYAGLQLQSFHTPSFSESAVSGSNQFALTAIAQTTTDTRGELGSWFDKTIQLSNANTLTMFARAAYAHDWGNAGIVTEQFLSLPSPAFIINGAAPPPDKALVSAGSDVRFNNNWSIVGKFDGEFASRQQSYGGTATVRYTW
jgi:outer membrane autotransporter protein